MSTLKAYWIRKIGINRGAPRIWLDMPGLAEGGIESCLAVFNEIHQGYAEQSLLYNPVSKGAAPLCAPMQELVQDHWTMAHLPQVEVKELGLPCSGASVAGKTKLGLAKMEDHPQVGHLVHAALVLENVTDYARSASAQLMRHQLADMGYQVEEFVLKARDFAALENPVRWTLVATTVGIPPLGELQTWSSPQQASAQALGSLLDPVEDDAPCWQEMSYLRHKQVRDIADGKGFMMQLVSADSTHVPTIRKHYNKGGSTDPYLQPPRQAGLLRKFTPGEHARIKGVPPSLVEGMSTTSAHEALGQGIVAAPFKALFRRLGECMKLAVVADPHAQLPAWAAGDGRISG